MNDEGERTESTPAARGRGGCSEDDIVPALLARLRATLRLLLEDERELVLDRHVAILEGARSDLEELARTWSNQERDPRSPRSAEHPASPCPSSISSSFKRDFSVLVADDDEEVLDLLFELLRDRYAVTRARDGAMALAIMKSHRFDLAIVDLQLPAMDGFQVAEAVLRGEVPLAPAIIFLSAQASSQAKVRGLTLGAVDYVTKPFDSDELLARIERTLCSVQREANLAREALTDPLTGLSNYRSLVRSLERELERARRYGEPVSLLTLDLDNLKRINDEYGHPAGNEAIELVGHVLESVVRRFETVARQGGDEFSVLLPNTGLPEAERLAERLRTHVASLCCRGAPLSISVGVAVQEPGSPLSAEELMEHSDEALYRAKRAGRNRVELRQSTSRIQSNDDRKHASTG